MAAINFSGLASGIDTEGLVKATSDATRSTRVKPLQRKVDEYTGTNDSLDELRSLLATAQSKARDMSSVFGGPLQKLASTSDETVLTASASNAATNGSYSLTVSQLAKNATMSLYDNGSPYSSSSSTLPTSGTVTVTVGAAPGTPIPVSVAVTAGVTTLSQFVTDFNTNAAAAGATASVVNVGTTSNDFRIVINSTNTGTSKGQLTLTTPVAGLDDSVVSSATNSTFNIGGVGNITRATNSIADVIPGVTFELNSTSASAVTVNVTNDVSATTAKVSDFVKAYNDVVKFVAENNVITREQNGNNVSNTFAPLSKTRVDDNVLSQIRSAISSSSYSSGTEIKIMADLGITTQRDGTLKFDSATFSSALSKEPTSVNSILQTFGDTVGLTGGTIDLYTRFGGIFDTAINGNKSQIDNLNDRIALVEEQIARTEASMRARFARLESSMGRMQQQQSSLSSALAQLG